MNHEKQHAIPKRRPLSNVGAQSPKLGGKSSSLPKLAGSPAIRTSPTTERAGSKVGLDDGRDSHWDDTVATPVKTFLGNNVTPRSGARKARAENGSPISHGACSGTPVTSRPSSSYGRNERNDYSVEDGVAISGYGSRIPSTRRSRTGSMVSEGPSSYVSSAPMPPARDPSATRVTSPESVPQFFHADDVKHTIPNRSADSPVPNGRIPRLAPNKDENVAHGRSSSMSNNSTTDIQKGSDIHMYEPKFTSPRPASAQISNRPPLQTIYSAYTANSPPRASSPLKEEVLPRTSSIHKASPRRHTRLVSNGGSELKSPEVIHVEGGEISRRSSLITPRNPRFSTHARSRSVQSSDFNPSRRSSIALSDTSPIERVRTTSLVGANGTFPHSVNPPSTTQELPDHELISPPQSPIKAPSGGQSKIDQMNELAAKARRERKVLDLEISNSSLLTVNRTLEREMRKQSAELRRYRRLSRSGRISIAPSSRSASGKMSILSEPDTNTNSDEIVSSTDEDGISADEGSRKSSISANSQTSAAESRAARCRFQDPTRVKLDLAPHRALLLDSQKLNLSIKHCLGQSELLISSGKRALAYRAPMRKPEDLGPRVLTPDDVEEEYLSHGQGLLSPIHDQADINPWEKSLESTGSLDGALETPDYSLWGSPSVTQTPFAEIVATGDDSMNGDVKSEDLQQIPDPGEEIEDDDLPDIDDEARRPSMIASIDGLDDDFESDSSGETRKERPILTTQGTNPDSYAARAERKRNPISKVPDPQPGQPGYRGSMQNLGHYLQAFSIFGAPQQT